ncbi:hypothetical protein LguiB_030222 [Lonicera macranthoides]
MEGEIKNIVHVWLSIIASLCYCYFISSNIPKGFYRFVSLLPILSLFTFLPLYHSSPFNTAVTTLFITWLANSKLLLFAFDRGPLSSDHPRKSSLILFIALASFPIQIRDGPPPSTPKKLPLNLAVEVLAFAILVSVLYRYKHLLLLHPKTVMVLYCFLLFFLIDILITFSSNIIRVIVGLELEPASDEPYLSTSLQDFWGRRWNLMVTNTLRHTVFRPVRTACKPILGNDWAPIPAVLGAFAVSGLMHELLFFYVTRVTPTWEMTAFFVVHGVCVVLEFEVKRAFTGKCLLPGIVSGPLTVGFVVATSFWLFFPPVMRSGADVKVIQDFKVFAEFLTNN